MDEQFSLSDLVVADDINVEVDPEKYQDQASPAPLVAGIYRGRVISHGPKLDWETKRPAYEKDEQGKPAFPIIVLQGIELVEGVENPPRKVYPFREVKTKPFERPYGSGQKVTDIGDLTRAFDQTRGWSGLSAGIDLVKEYIEMGQLFTAGYNWSVYDKELVEAGREQLGLVGPQTEEPAKKLLNAVYKAARVEGMNNFPPLRSGFPNHILTRGNVTIVNPSTNVPIVIEVATRFLEAKLVLTRFYPSLSERVTLGPIAYKPRAAALRVAA